MTKLSIDDVTRVAVLARLGLSDAELEKYALELTAILNFVTDLQSIDTSGIDSTSQVTGLTDVWREDKVVDCAISREELLANVPMHEGSFVKVKRVLE